MSFVMPSDPRFTWQAEPLPMMHDQPQHFWYNGPCCAMNTYGMRLEAVERVETLAGLLEEEECGWMHLVIAGFMACECTDGGCYHARRDGMRQRPFIESRHEWPNEWPWPTDASRVVTDTGNEGAHSG